LLTWTVEQAVRIDATTRRLIDHKPLVIGAVLLTMLLQFLALSSYQVLVYALHMPRDGSKVWDYYAFLGTGNVAAALPITYQGVGVMEALYKKFMSGGHGTMAQILCLAMAVRVLHLFWSLPGFFVTMTGGYRPREGPAGEPDLAAADEQVATPPDRPADSAQRQPTRDRDSLGSITSPIHVRE
jgi:hypothetical protein